jgi:hypothetical protein
MYFPVDYNESLGTIRRVRITQFPLVQHWGVEGWYRDENGQPTMRHAQKNDILRCTSYAEFSSGQPSEIVWTPQDFAQGAWVVQRLESKEGLRWNLATANCEQIVRWAVEGRAHSDQLAFGVAACLVGAIAIVALNS